MLHAPHNTPRLRQPTTLFQSPCKNILLPVSRDHHRLQCLAGERWLSALHVWFKRQLETRLESFSPTECETRPGSRTATEYIMAFVRVLLPFYMPMVAPLAPPFISPAPKRLLMHPSTPSLCPLSPHFVVGDAQKSAGIAPYWLVAA
jgi:hypothetical protein